MPYETSHPSRVSTRNKTRPSWWTNYHVSSNSKPNVLFSTITHSSPKPVPELNSSLPDLFSLHLSNHTYDSESQEFLAFSNQSDVIPEPNHYYQAIKDPRWVEAITKEL